MGYTVTAIGPIRSVNTVITKSEELRGGSPITVNQEYDYRLNWTTRCPVTNQS